MRQRFFEKSGEYEDEDELPVDTLAIWDALDWVMGDGPDDLITDHLPPEESEETANVTDRT